MPFGTNPESTRLISQANLGDVSAECPFTALKIPVSALKRYNGLCLLNGM
jgi:hypothetical protein